MDYFSYVFIYKTLDISLYLRDRKTDAPRPTERNGKRKRNTEESKESFYYGQQGHMAVCDCSNRTEHAAPSLFEEKHE